MMTFYAAAGSYQIREENGKKMPYIMRLGKLQPVSIPEFCIWSMNWAFCLAISSASPSQISRQMKCARGSTP